ncbi:phosphatase PAP2 family protein [Mycolicibacterium sp. Dal123E01]|uniref:phosphatase PAP2 family protein n=1 Tax=Mycolicibacterium sp. Dal123E01 TaxID=3457578 RepID=UPI00403E613C
MTALDGHAAAWIDYRAQRSPRLHAGAEKVARFGSPLAVALAGLLGAALLSVLHRSAVVGVVVVATIGAAVLAKDVMKIVIERPVSHAEILAAPELSGEPHPFPSGHVAGTAALLGIVAFGLGVGCGYAVRAVLASCVVAGTLIVGVSRLVLDAHWLSDVVGGVLLAGVVVSLGAAALSSSSRARSRVPRGRAPQQQPVDQYRRLRRRPLT